MDSNDKDGRQRRFVEEVSDVSEEDIEEEDRLYAMEIPAEGPLASHDEDDIWLERPLGESHI